MEIMLKNKCCLYVIISIRFFSITICNLLIESPSYFNRCNSNAFCNCENRSIYATWYSYLRWTLRAK